MASDLCLASVVDEAKLGFSGRRKTERGKVRRAGFKRAISDFRLPTSVL